MAKRKNLVLSLLMAAFIAGMSLMSTTFSGCSALPPYKACVDCSQFPLVYQGTIIEYTQGVYLETACITIDLSKVGGGRDFKIGDIIYVEYVIKQGEFCEPDDKSTYRVYTTDGPQPDSPYEDVQVNGSAIQMKEQSNAGTPPIIPTAFLATALVMAGMFNFGSNYTPILSSRTKFGSWIIALCLIGYIVASFFPVETGVVWEAALWEKVIAIVTVVGALFQVTGIRNLFDDGVNALKEGRDPNLGDSSVPDEKIE